MHYTLTIKQIKIAQIDFTLQKLPEESNPNCTIKTL